MRSSAIPSTVFLCLDDFLLLQYEGFISIAHSPLHNPRTGQLVRYKNEIIDTSASLNGENLRSIFVKLEALVFKCVHILLKEQRAGYTERTEQYEKRLELLLDAKYLTNSQAQLAQELYLTRCQFAHSIRDIEQLQYLGCSLSDRWGSRGTMQTRKFKRYFLHDAYRYSEILLSIFKPIQKHQLNGVAFRSVLQEYYEETSPLAR